ncbi:LEPR-XLL domain-containing protein [Roseateles sp. LKC17W]|uniref:LEPR-XLL domain-containing protein n=1 Tax=Pelomonas margarita TaxID=3299031 RepID=A0ABW7FJX3_9BURK
MKLRSLLPRRWREAPPAAPRAVKPSLRAWSLEALEPRVLLSADPVLGAAHLALQPLDGGDADLFSQAYSPEPADAGPTMRILAVTLPNGGVTSPIVGASYSLPNDSLQVSGNLSIQATAGNITIGTLGHGDKISGASSATADHLTLSATGNVTINAEVNVGAAGTDLLASLTVLSAQNVSFKEGVTLDGALTINATGTVTFDAPLTLRNGGSLTINGATQIVMKGAVALQLNGASTAGNILLEADEIDLFDVGEELISGSGSVTLRPATLAQGMALFSPQGAPTAATLNLDATDLRAFADGFSGFVFGHRSAGHATVGAGTVLVGASTAPDSFAMHDPVQVYGGSITVSDYSAANAILRLGSGNSLSLDARTDIAIYNEIEADQIQLYSATGRIAQFDAGADARSAEAVRTLSLTAVAVTGVSLPSLEVGQLDVDNTGSGNIDLGQNAARATTRFPTEIDGSLDIGHLAQTAVSGANGISVLARAGSVQLLSGAGISLAGTGALSVVAQGAGSDISLLAPVSLVSGAATFNAADAFTASAAATITASGASTVSITSGTGALTLGAAVTTVGGTLTLSSGGALDLTGVTLSAGASGAITLTAAGDLKVGVISAASSIHLTSTGGAILDALSGNGANLIGDAASVTLTAANGVGTGAAPLLTTIGSLTATVSGSSGGIFISESTALTLAAGGLTTAGSGAIVVLNSAGDLTAVGAVQANGTGHILLDAVAGNLIVQNDVLAQGGSISLVAGAALSATGTQVRSNGANQTLDLRAGTGLTLGGTTLLATAHAAQRVQAGGAIVLGGVSAGSGTVTLIAGDTLASASQAASISAASLRVQAVNGIATGSAPLQTQVANLAASSGGSVAVNELDDVSVGSVAEVAVNRVGSSGTVSASTPASALAGLAATGSGTLVLNAGGSITLNAAASAASHLRLSAGSALAVNAAVASSGGQLTLLAGGAISHAAAGVLSTAGGAIDEQAGDALSFAAATTVNSQGGRLRLQSGGAMTLGQLDAGTGEAWLQGMRIVGASGSTALDLRAGAARLIATGTGAADGLGLGTDALSLNVQRLAAQSAGAGGVFLAEGDAVALDGLLASAGPRVQADGSTAALTVDPTLSGLTSAGTLVLTAPGDVVIISSVTAQRALLSSGNDLSLTGAATVAGALSLAAGRDMLLNQVAPSLAIAAGSTLDVQAGRDLTMGATTLLSAQGAAALQAGGDMRLAVVDVAGTKSLTVIAGGTLRDADAPGDTAVNLKAGRLMLTTGGSVGVSGNAIETTATWLSASAAGGLYVDETDALGIAGTLTGFGSVERVVADGTLSALALAEVQGLSSTTVATAPLVLRTLAGALTVNAAVQTLSSAVRLEASGAITLNAAVTGSNMISILAGGAVQQGAAIAVGSGGGNVDLQAAGAWTMVQGSSITSGGVGSTLRLAATGALALAQMDAGIGAISLTATEVKDLAGDAAGADITGASLLLRTTGTAATNGVGSGTDAVDVAVLRLAVDTAGGGVFLAHSGNVLVDSLTAFTSSRTQLDGSVNAAALSDAALAGVRSSASLVLAATGSIGVQAATSAAGTVLLSSAADLAIGAALTGTAAMSLNAGRDLALNASVTSSGSTRSLDLVAGRDLTQAQGAALQTANGVISLQANRDLTLESVNAGTAGVAVIAGGAVVDGDTAGDAETDITASALRLTAAGAVGTGANALETAVTTLSASAASLALVQGQALTLDRVATSLVRVGADGATTALDLGAQEDLTTHSGALLLTVNSGDLTINGGTASAEQAVNAGGALLLRASTGSIAVKAGLVAAGPASLRAGGDLSATATGDITLAGASSLDAEAGASITLADGSVFSSGTGTLRLAATLNLAVGALQTGGDVSLLARSITDAGGAETDVVARALRIVTTGTGTTQGVGTGAAPLQLQVGTLAASVAGTGAGGFFAREADGLNIDSVAVSVSRVAADGTQAALADAALADLVSGGNIVLVAGGSLALADGSNADGLTLQSGGNVLLDAAGDLLVSAQLRSTSGAVSLLAGGTMTLAADVAITRTGRTLDLQAGGAVSMAASADLTVVDSAIRVQAGGDLRVAGIAAGLGQVSLVSTGGSILATAGHAGAEVSAASLRLQAAVGVGSAEDRLDTAVQRVSARAASGGIWLHEADAITITDVAVSVRRVSALATTTATVDDATQSDLVTTAGNGSIGLSTVDGNISFADGTAPADTRSVTAHGSGSVSLKAGGATAVVNLPPGSIEQQGAVSIDSGLKFDGAVAITGGQGGGRGDGAITVGGAIDGTAGGAADTLVVTSDGADVVFGGAIGGIERLGGLVVNDARNLSFNQDVRLAGDLTLQASGRVEFKGALDLSAGALRIVGATELVVGNVVIASGSAVIRVDALTLSGLISGSSGARIELAGASGGVAVGTAGSGLALSAVQLGALRGFGQVQIGRSDAGPTAVSIAALNALATPQLTLAGASLDLQGGSTALNTAVTLLDLSAAQDLTLAGALTLAAAGADVRATVGGALRMAADGQLATQAGEVQLQAGGDLRVGRIDTRAAGSGTAAAVVLASSGGSISEANADSMADVFADLLTLRGRGPVLAGGASEALAALDVQANRLDVDGPSGVMLRDSGSDGRTRFNLLDGGQLYQQLVALGAPARQASEAAAPTAQQAGAAPAEAWAWLNAVRPLAESRAAPLAGLWTAGPTMSALAAAPVREAALVFADDPAPLLPSQLAALLNLDAATVQALPQDPQRFRGWSEELVL